MPPRPDPFATGMLPAAHGAELYWEATGNPVGIPLLYLHGGPGGTLSVGGYRRRFDPDTHLLIGFDQRGCGRSRPLVSDDPASLSTNTTAQLIDDIEALREHFGIDQWIIHGVSWGSTLALAYALAHPSRVLAVALMAVTTTSAREVRSITRGAGRIFPEEWARFVGAFDIDEGDAVVADYAARMAAIDSGARGDRVAAADAWDRWESTHMSLDPYWKPGWLHEDPEQRLVFGTLVSHYWAAAGFMRGADCGEPEPILARIGELEGIPGLLVHGRRDISGPAETAWLVHRGWPGSELVIVEEEGHGGPIGSQILSDWVAGLVR